MSPRQSCWHPLSVSVTASQARSGFPSHQWVSQAHLGSLQAFLLPLPQAGLCFPVCVAFSSWPKRGLCPPGPYCSQQQPEEARLINVSPSPERRVFGAHLPEPPVWVLTRHPGQWLLAPEQGEPRPVAGGWSLEEGRSGRVGPRARAAGGSLCCPHKCVGTLWVS